MLSHLFRLKQAYHLTRKPHYQLVEWLSEYLVQLGGRQSFSRKRPLAHDGTPLPWITYPAIAYLDQIDTTTLSIFEYGSGIGSLFWAQRARCVVSVEDDSAWIEELCPFLHENQKIVFAAEREEYVHSIEKIDEPPDIVVIDGRYRRDCSEAAANAVSPSGMIILDNSDWYASSCEFLTGKGFRQIDFIGPGPVNSYAWATSIFIPGSAPIPGTRKHAAPLVSGGLRQLGDEE